jgi:hypothetical protein
MTGSVGPRGLTLLLVAGAVALALAIIGWAQRGTARTGTGRSRSRSWPRARDDEQALGHRQAEIPADCTGQAGRSAGRAG